MRALDELGFNLKATRSLRALKRVKLKTVDPDGVVEHKLVTVWVHSAEPVCFVFQLPDHVAAALKLEVRLARTTTTELFKAYELVIEHYLLWMEKARKRRVVLLNVGYRAETKGGRVADPNHTRDSLGQYPTKEARENGTYCMLEIGWTIKIEVNGEVYDDQDETSEEDFGRLSLSQRRVRTYPGDIVLPYSKELVERLEAIRQVINRAALSLRDLTALDGDRMLAALLSGQNLLGPAPEAKVLVEPACRCPQPNGDPWRCERDKASPSREKIACDCECHRDSSPPPAMVDEEQKGFLVLRFFRDLVDAQRLEFFTQVGLGPVVDHENMQQSQQLQVLDYVIKHKGLADLEAAIEKFTEKAE